MVWFQCEDCGEALKKPKLRGHFGGCSASKLACIDCGVVFNKQTVQAHTSCMTEMEKFGPKGENAKKGGTQASAHGSGEKQGQKTPTKPGDEGLDFRMGLTTAYPWKCSLCNVSATSEENLWSHSEGKKHRSKVRGATRAAAAAAGESAGSGGSDKIVSNGDASENGADVDASTATAVATKGGKETPLEGNGQEVEKKEKKSRKEKKEKPGKGGKDANGGASGDAQNGSEPEKSERKEKSEKKRKGGPKGAPKEGGEAEDGASKKEAKKSKKSTAGDEQQVNGANGVANGGADSLKAKEGKGKSNSAAASEREPDGVEAEYSVPWKKLIKKTLKQDPTHSLPLRKLRLAVVDAAVEHMTSKGVKAGADRDALLQEFKSALGRYKSFAQEGKQVVLKET